MRTLSAIILTLSVSIAHANHDGSHTPDCQHMQPNFSLNYLDENADGKVSKQEYLDGDSSHVAKTFEHIDANGDGVLDKDELSEIEKVYQHIHQRNKTGKTTNL